MSRQSRLFVILTVMAERYSHLAGPEQARGEHGAEAERATQRP